MRKILRHINPMMANKVVQAKAFYGRGMLAHHGIQRSGTNYLNECLWRCGCPPLNTFNESRNSPKNKHFRWYDDKSVIPIFLRKQYNNSLSAHSVYELNRFAGYTQNTVHIVIKKEKISWLASILNWGIFCDWFSGKESAMHHLQTLADDYACYYDFWEEMERKYPNKICVISFDLMKDEFSILPRYLKRVGVHINCGRFDGVLENVPQSPKTRKQEITKEDIIEFMG